MKRIEALTQSQLDSFVPIPGGGGFLIPEGIEIYEKPIRKDELKDIIKAKETEFALLVEPTNNELIEWGKLLHPYHQAKEELKALKDELKSLK
jgi:arsenate reductase-like glutaredoxin family protein